MALLSLDRDINSCLGIDTVLSEGSVIETEHNQSQGKFVLRRHFITLTPHITNPPISTGSSGQRTKRKKKSSPNPEKSLKKQKSSETVCYLQSIADDIDIIPDGEQPLENPDQSKIQLAEGKEGNKKISLPDTVLEAVYEENWEKVTFFLSKQNVLLPPLQADKLERVLAITEKLREQVRNNVEIDKTECGPDCKKCLDDDHCKLWKGPFRQAKGRHYAIRSFPKLKLNNESVMRLLLCWKYPEAARKVGFMSSSFRRVICNTCGTTICVNEKHCKIKGVFENGQFILSKNKNSEVEENHSPKEDEDTSTINEPMMN